MSQGGKIGPSHYVVKNPGSYTSSDSPHLYIKKGIAGKIS